MSAALAHPAPAPPVHAMTDKGLTRSAQLMLTLGPRARGIWQRLEGREIDALQGEMERLSSGAHHADTFAASAFLTDGSRLSHTPHAGTGDVWQRLAALDGDTLAALVDGEPAPVIAAIALRLPSLAAARLIGALETGRALDLLFRLMRHAPAPRPVLALIEAEMDRRLASGAVQTGGRARIAGILDRMGQAEAAPLLSALASQAPDEAEHVRALMFTFEDLGRLDAPGIQTLLARVDRALLAMALKGSGGELQTLFFANMTQRARAQLTEEMGALGPVRRSEIDKARQGVMEEVRRLIARGELDTHLDTNPDDLVE